MSNNESVDEETKRILSEVNPDDSKGSTKNVKNKDGYQEYEINNDMDADDEDW